MQYLDSGNRDPSQALGTWLEATVNDEITEIRWQSGFFASDSLGFLQRALQRLRDEHGVVRALIGSNDQSTIRTDVERLVQLIGLPRENASLGVVSFGDGYYHPKTLHLIRRDGSQAAYVGSANLTASGVTSLHVEAGVVFDTRDNDSAAFIAQIGQAVDLWFDTNIAGLYLVNDLETVRQLVEQGIIAEIRPSRPTPSSSGTSDRRPGPLVRLRRLILLPEVEEPPAVEAEPPPEIVAAAPQVGFPDYLLFAPEQNTATHGLAALSGSSLPAGAAGLIIRINRDSGRHFENRPGTANISIPTATLTTFRFGFRIGKYRRPCVVFQLAVRYLHNDGIFVLPGSKTNIMAYGFVPGEAGHRDVRMLIPKAISKLVPAIQQAGLSVPRDGDVALLEWPTMNPQREFRLTFLDRATPQYQEAARLFIQAQEQGSTVGVGACWLPEALTVAWE